MMCHVSILLPCKDIPNNSHFILWCMYWPQSSHAPIWIILIHQSKVINNEDIYVVCNMQYWMMPHHTSLLDGYRVEIKYSNHVLLCINGHIYTNRYIIWIVANSVYYIFVVIIIYNIVVHYELYVYTNVDVLKWCVRNHYTPLFT